MCRSSVESGSAGVLVAGSTGEAPYLTEGERLRLVEVARDLVRPPEILIAGVGLESTDATVRLSQEAVARGADAVLVLTPNYYKSKMDADTLAAHYRAVASKVERPVIIYSIPQFTGLHVEPSTIGKLSQIPNVVGLKESSGDIRFVRAVLRRVRPGFRVLVGSVVILYRGLARGSGGRGAGPGEFCSGAVRGPVPGIPARQEKEGAGISGETASTCPEDCAAFWRSRYKGGAGPQRLCRGLPARPACAPGARITRIGGGSSP